MDLPPDKAKVLNSYDDDKKWDIICDQVCILLLCVTVIFHLSVTTVGFLFCSYF